MQAVATIAPAIAALFFTQYVVSLTGVDAPFAYILGVCIVLMLGSTLVQLSKHMSSAGGYYTFVSRALGPRVGFMTAWMYVFYNPVCAGPIYAYFGYLLSQELKTHYSINAPYLWWLTLVVGAPFVAFLAWRGLALSVKVLVGLGLTEMAIVFSLALSGLASPGPGGFNLSSFVPTHSLSGEGFALAIVFSLQALTGWEAAAPLAEETSNPRRNVPLATMIAIIGLGIFLVICYWGQIVGWGTSILTGSSPKSMVNSPDLPGLVIAAAFVGRRLGDSARRDVQLHLGRVPGVQQRLDAYLVQDGRDRHIAVVVRTRASRPQDAYTRDPGQPCVVFGGGSWPRLRLQRCPLVLLVERSRAGARGAVHIRVGQCRRRFLLPEAAPERVQRGIAHRVARSCLPWRCSM